jgi:anti-anti-sigma factor
MPIDWSENIVVAELVDEPHLAEEFSDIFERLGKAGADGAMPHVVLNFSAVTFLNSSHIASLLRMRKRLAEKGRQLVLCSMGDDVWSVLVLTGLDKVFKYAPDPLTALAGIQIADAGRA